MEVYATGKCQCITVGMNSGKLTSSIHLDRSKEVADARMSLQEPDASVIIMAFNEGPTLTSVVDELDSAFEGTPWRHETIIVNDGSTDDTGPQADRLALERSHVRVIHHLSNSGIGEVYRSGFVSARGRLVSFLPADGQFPATIITDFLLLANHHDLILGYIPNRRSSLSAKVLSAAERSLYRVMFGPLPQFQGIMMFSRHLLRQLDITPSGRGWGVLMEIIVLARRSGLRIASVPTPLRSRRAGRSKVMNVSSIWANLKQAAGLWWRLRRFGRRA